MTTIGEKRSRTASSSQLGKKQQPSPLHEQKLSLINKISIKTINVFSEWINSQKTSTRIIFFNHKKNKDNLCSLLQVIGKCDINRKNLTTILSTINNGGQLETFASLHNNISKIWYSYVVEKSKKMDLHHILSSSFESDINKI